jgi:hypothetical protein
MVGAERRQLALGSGREIPRDVMHDFRNEGQSDVGLLGILVGGPFEESVPMIVNSLREKSCPPNLILDPRQLNLSAARKASE